MYTKYENKKHLRSEQLMRVEDVDVLRRFACEDGQQTSSHAQRTHHALSPGVLKPVPGLLTPQSEYDKYWLLGKS